MKTMLLVTKRKSVQEMYRAELEKVFGGRLRIQPCVHPSDGTDFSSESGIAQADIVLITNPYSFPWARRQMRPDAQIINLNFSFAREKLEALKRFPVGTEALACFNFYSSAHQAVYALYEAGVTNMWIWPSSRVPPTTFLRAFPRSSTWGPERSPLPPCWISQ